MASFLMDFVWCLLPILLLLLLSLALRWPRAYSWTRLAVRAAGWRLWVIICLILGLPLDKQTITQTKEAGSAERDILSGSSQVSDGPQIICKATALAKYLLGHCDSLTRPRLASWPRGDPHLQTLSSLLYGQHGNTVQFTRDHLLLKDGGIVALDWAEGTRQAERKKWEGRREHQPGGKILGCVTSNPPVLLLIPQFWGGMTLHLKMLCHQAIRQGFYVVVSHPRGTAGCPLTTARLTEFGDPADLEQVIAYVHSRHPSSALFAVSEGSGSGTLLSYLGESGSSSYLTAAAAISPVLLGQQWFETAMPPIYHWGILFQRKMQLRRYADSFRGVLDVDRALSCSSLRDFEETLTCSSSLLQQKTTRPSTCSSSSGLTPGTSSKGFAPSVAWVLGERAYPAKDWNSYWERNEPLRDADEVAVPVLCITSCDDPLLPPASSLPLPLFKSNPYFLLALTDRGGHCGFTLEGQEEEKEGGRTGNEEVEEYNWSHFVVLEYFRVVADFLKKEERENAMWGATADFSLAGQLSRISSMAPLRKRRNTVMRKSRLQAAQQSYLEEEENFTWKRSYTR
ncbi:protein ABHD15 [Tautogolabrus adspersus]